MPSLSEIKQLLGGLPQSEEHLGSLLDQLSSGSTILPFVGAGMSVPFGLPQWDGFLLKLAKEAGRYEKTKAQLETLAYEEAAEDLVTALGQRRFQDLLSGSFGTSALAGKIIDGAVAELTRFPPGPLITTNFDRVLETAFAQAGRPVQAYSPMDAGKGVEALQQNTPFLLKLHGDWDRPQSRVLTLSEYQEAYGDVTADGLNFKLPLPTLLFQLLTSRCCLFLGCSLKQDRTASILRAIFRTASTLVHYALMEKPADDGAFHQRAAELSQLSIRPIWFPTRRFDTIAPLLSFLADESLSRLRKWIGRIAEGHGHAVPNNIPELTSRTVGREEEIVHVREMLRVSRVVTITGPGGCGKSRLAAEVASAVKSQFPDGVWIVSLADLAKSSSAKDYVVPSRIAKIIGAHEAPGSSPANAVTAHIGRKRLLLVLDNCEHLVDACRGVVAALISECPALTVLTTSRRPLNRIGATGAQYLRQERLYPLAPLQVPEAEVTDFEAIRNSESVILFVQCVQRRSPDWRLEARNAESVAEICRALDGIPLAIEVAAARLGVVSVDQMRAQSHDLLRAIGDLRSGDLRRWKTLTAAIRWSYGLLRAKLKSFMLAMSVFEGGWTAEAAQAVYDKVSGGDGDQTLDCLSELLDSSLLLATDVNRAKRFRFLEPVRQFCQIQLSPQHRAELERAHTAYFVELSEQAAPELLKAQQTEWLNRLQAEADNLRAAIRWSIKHTEAECGLRLMAALWRFTEIRGYLTEGRDRCHDVLAIPGAEQLPELHARVLSGAGMLAYRQGDFAEAMRMFERSLAIETALGNDSGRANSLNDLGNVAMVQGDCKCARELFSESLAIDERLGNSRSVAVTKFNLGSVAMGVGDYDEARRLMTESLRAFRDSGNHRESAFPLNGLAQVHAALGQADLAEEYAQESYAIRKSLKDTKGLSDATRTLGWAALVSGEYGKALKHLSESIAMSRDLGDKRGVAESLDLLGLLNAATGEPECTVEVLAAADAIRRGFNYSLPPAREAQRQAALSRARQELGPDNYQGYWARGNSLTTRQAIERALNRATAQRQLSSVAQSS